MSVQSRNILGESFDDGQPNPAAVQGSEPPSTYIPDRYHEITVAYDESFRHHGGRATSDITSSRGGRHPGDVDEGLGGYGKAVG